MSKRAPFRWKRFFRRLVIVCGALLLLAIAFVTWANIVPVVRSRGLLFEEAASVPKHRVGLIFGCDPRFEGRENSFFRYRIDAAVALWKAGRIGCLIVSGDNRAKNYNEPEAMRTALVAAGVPRDRIVCDFAGLRTLDSVVRAKEVFDVKEVVFITQRFQNQRAIYLAQANGMDAIGFDAQDPAIDWRHPTRLREIGARIKMWLDVNVLSTPPRYLGAKQALPEG